MNPIWPVDLDDGGRDGVAQTFERPAWRVAFDLVAAPIGAVLFLGMAIALLGDALAHPSDLPGPIGQMQYLAPAMFGLFGLIMGAAAIASIQRGLQRNLLEVGPRGIWTPEMGRLAWDEVAEIRCDRVVGATVAGVGSLAAGNRAGEGGGFLMLGIVPRDGAVAKRARSAVAWRLSEYATDVLGWIARQVRWTRPSDLAPFCVADYEIGGRMDEAIAAIRQYHEVTDTRLPASATAS
jgi:hypothetical protein